MSLAHPLATRPNCKPSGAEGRGGLSGRNSFEARDRIETAIKERIPEALILRRLAGHSVAHSLTSGRGQFDIHTDTYTGAFSIKSMKRVIDRLDYPGVVFHGYISPDDAKRQRMKKPAKKAGSVEVSSEDLGALLSKK